MYGVLEGLDADPAIIEGKGVDAILTSADPVIDDED
jgi:hypothetical protein